MDFKKYLYFFDILKNDENPENLDLENPSTIIDEHFVPESGLDLDTYIKNGDIAGVHHLIRYYWTRQIITDNLSTKTILDIACGSGFGSYLIAKNFPNVAVIGADYDLQAIEDAQKNYSLPNLTFQFGDGCRWDETIGENKFDCIISFDTLEHISHREIMMQNLAEHLSESGYLLLSTPLSPINTNLCPDWEHHKIEYSAASLYDFLSRYFKTILRPDDLSLPNMKFFDCLNDTEIYYHLLMNPLLLKDPIIVKNP